MPSSVKKNHIKRRKPEPESTGICAMPCAIATLNGFIHEAPKPICVAQ